MTTKGYPTVTHKMAKLCASVIALILLLAAPARAQSYTIAPPPFQTILDDSGNIVVGGCVWTYAAGTSTPISTYSNNSGTANTNPIVADLTGRFTAYLLAGTNYKFVYENTPCSVSPPTHGPVLRTADNITGTPGAAATVDITCTAGETISAGQAVYLSAGSGGKTAGQCYKGDSANTYSSSTATVVGLAPAAIPSGAAGTVRIAGSVSGLSSLTTGNDYYVGTAGAITATAPANVRKLGAADTPTSLVLTLPTSSPTGPNNTDDFRISGSSGTCVPSTDVTAATTLYLTPCTGNRIALFDSTGTVTLYSTAEISIAVPATTSQMYDVFVFASGTTPTLELLAWTNDTTRATALVRTTTGAYTKSGDLTRRYVASFRTTGVSGQTEDSLAKRYIWNYYNRVARPMLVIDATASWTYTTGTFHQANASAANQLDFVVGINESPVAAQVFGMASDTTSGTRVVGIGLDSTTADATGVTSGAANFSAANYVQPLIARGDFSVAAGRHTLVWLEASISGTATTWYGKDKFITGNSSGISGVVFG